MINDLNKPLQHIHYIPAGIPIESRALQRIILQNLVKKDNFVEVKAINSFLYDSIDSNKTLIVLWFPVVISLFQPLFETEFARTHTTILDITNNYKLLWEEYLTWIDYCYVKNTNNLSTAKENLLYFYMFANNTTFSNKNKTEMKKTIMRKNPFIKYWFNCFNLLKFLRLPANVIVLPNLKKNRFLDAIKNKTITKELYDL